MSRLQKYIWFLPGGMASQATKMKIVVWQNEEPKRESSLRKCEWVSEWVSEVDFVEEKRIDGDERGNPSKKTAASCHQQIFMFPLSCLDIYFSTQKFNRPLTFFPFVQLHQFYFVFD